MAQIPRTRADNAKLDVTPRVAEFAKFAFFFLFDTLMIADTHAESDEMIYFYGLTLTVSKRKKVQNRRIKCRVKINKIELYISERQLKQCRDFFPLRRFTRFVKFSTKVKDAGNVSRRKNARLN